MFSSDFLLAYFAMLRVSELDVASQSDENGHALNFNDVIFAENNGQTEIYIKIRSSKSDQKRHSVTL